MLGFMVAAVGMGAYIAGMFNLVTHAFFKALLFLSAGSVILGLERGHHHLPHGAHGKHEEVFDPADMRNMGGLRKRMPETFWGYLIVAPALAGIFPLAGFWSKDEILADAFADGYTLVYWLLTIAAFFTAFYMGRQIWMVFFGKPRHAAAKHAEESPWIVTGPLVALAVLSIFGGVVRVQIHYDKAVAAPAEYQIVSIRDLLRLFTKNAAGALPGKAVLNPPWRPYRLYHRRPPPGTITTPPWRGLRFSVVAAPFAHPPTQAICP